MESRNSKICCPKIKSLIFQARNILLSALHGKIAHLTKDKDDTVISYPTYPTGRLDQIQTVIGEYETSMLAYPEKKLDEFNLYDILKFLNQNNDEVFKDHNADLFICIVLINCIEILNQVVAPSTKYPSLKPKLFEAVNQAIQMLSHALTMVYELSGDIDSEYLLKIIKGTKKGKVIEIELLNNKKEIHLFIEKQHLGKALPPYHIAILILGLLNAHELNAEENKITLYGWAKANPFLANLILQKFNDVLLPKQIIDILVQHYRDLYYKLELEFMKACPGLLEFLNTLINMQMKIKDEKKQEDKFHLLSALNTRSIVKLIDCPDLINYIKALYNEFVKQKSLEPIPLSSNRTEKKCE